MTEIIIDDYLPSDRKSKKIHISSIRLKGLNDKEKSNTKVKSQKLGELKCKINQNEKEELYVNNINLCKINKNVFINLSNLLILNLSENLLFKISRKFLLLTRLKHLNLDANKIQSLPSYISELSSLEILSINKNEIKEVPISLQYLTKLRVFQISNNKISNLPIEFGMLKSLEVLYINNNFFTEIPVTLCYLNNLKEFRLEWFEFIEPPLTTEQINVYNILCMKNMLREMVNKGLLKCDYLTFISKLSHAVKLDADDDSFNSFQTDEKVADEKKTAESKNLFTIIEKDYFGIFKALIEENDERLYLKNTENKTAIYCIIQDNKSEYIDYIFNKINFKQLHLSYIYLHKAIRKRNYNLLVRLYNKGINLVAYDERGNGCYHILFSVFNKNFEQCCLIGNFLIEKKVPGLNKLNLDRWSPIHIASRYASKECIEWILKQNEKLIKQDWEIFEINIKGKNNWTPLHLTLSGYKYSESIIFINNGSDLFAKSVDGKKPRNVTNNYYLYKMAISRERDYYERKYIFNGKKEEKKIQKIKFNNNIDFFSFNFNTYLMRNGVKDASLFNKMISLINLRFTKSVRKIEVFLAEIIDQTGINSHVDYIILSEICDIILTYRLTSFIDLLISMQNMLSNKKTFLTYQIKNTIMLLKELKDSEQVRNFYKFNVDKESYSEKDESDSSKTEKNYLIYFEDKEEDTVKEDRRFMTEMNEKYGLFNDKKRNSEKENCKKESDSNLSGDFSESIILPYEGNIHLP